ncbi:hypothetical protein [Aciditerrimonas ferrireducens]|uniref:hypothetical protein n=1 Tax=Aciditerrimonas ferrireducens TaxID=667306 RepID=UPI002002DCB4|nr:hypothetical protein [Aciditerrimonas ferrireducens]MCK4176275.1 hypothetical protein [Aciditerrimonas ferrireducens]
MQNLVLQPVRDGESRCRPDLALVEPAPDPDGQDLVWAVIDAKTRSEAACNSAQVRSAFLTQGPEQLPEPARGLAFWAPNRRGQWCWLIQQHDAYRFSKLCYPSYWDLSRVRWILLSPNETYYCPNKYWELADFELLVEQLLELAWESPHPRPALEAAIGAYLAGPSRHQYRALPVTGKLRSASRLSRRWTDLLWNRELRWVAHRSRGLHLVLDDQRGWALQDPGGRIVDPQRAPDAEREAWERDLRDIGERPSWAPCPVQGCRGGACGHVDRYGSQLRDRPAA